MTFKATRPGTCGHCARPIAEGELIVKIKPHRVELPGRYGDMNRSRTVIVNYGHAECAEKVEVMK